jgi:DNA-directed RNA polymerase subunit beta'
LNAAVSAAIILFEIQKVYRSQGVDVSDKHVEIIAKRMISKIKIVNSGDSLYLPGTMVNINKFADINKELILQGKRPSTGRPVLLGITKASLETDSFLSAASFQETTRILTDAAIHGKVDNLEGLKENVILGKLIPAGTGFKKYKKVDYELAIDIMKEEPLEALEQELMD